MEPTSVQKIARVLNVLVIIALVCNILAMFLVPVLARQRYVDLWLYQDLLWDRSLIWQDVRAVALMIFLWFCGCCTAVILWQGRRVLKTIVRGEPFSMENSVSLRRAAVCAFLISAAALARAIWGVCYYESIRPLSTYNALFVPLFAMAGLLFLVMSALFRQAAELKAENDLTI